MRLLLLNTCNRFPHIFAVVMRQFVQHNLSGKLSERKVVHPSCSCISQCYCALNR